MLMAGMLLFVQRKQHLARIRRKDTPLQAGQHAERHKPYE
jgi:hypothetical protein